MDSARLSARTKQPGHDRTFTTSETNFVKALTLILPPERYEVIDHPRDLLRIFGIGAGRDLGIRPEASIRNRETERVMYFEVKKQGDAGNAEERAFKHHTFQFYKTLQTFTRMPYHAYCTIFCESLATNPRYTTKFRFLIEPGHYFLWADYEFKPLRQFIQDEICTRFLEGPVGEQTIPK
ncbi:MAG: hypothetical protein AABZ33_04300 [Chloroflexota bacterium]